MCCESQKKRLTLHFRTNVPMKRLLYIVLAFSMTCMACHRVKPQSPSSRTSSVAQNTVEDDSASMAAIRFHQQMAALADEQLISLVKQSKDTFAMYNFGVWVRKTIVTDAEEYKRGDKAEIHAVVRTIDDKPLYDIISTVNVGKKDIVFCIDIALYEMRHGEQAEILSPWYMAYGAAGDGIVPPYQNVKIQLTSLDK